MNLFSRMRPLRRLLVLVAIAALGNNACLAQLSNAPGNVYIEANGIVVGEAEIFTRRNPGPLDKNWWVVPDESAGVPGAPILNARRGKFVQLLPDDDNNGGGGVNQAPSLEFKMDIKTPGTYRLFVRWEGNKLKPNTSHSLFVDLVEQKDGAGGVVADWYELTRPIVGDFALLDWDGTGGFEKNEGGPSKVLMTWNIPRAGIYTLRFSQRQDGAAIDAFVFQLATRLAPTGIGPQVSATYIQSIFDRWGIPPAEVIDQLLDFAEYTYPELLPAPSPTAAFSRFRYRFYPQSGLYLGVAYGTTPSDGLVESGVYLMGGQFGDTPRLVGVVSDFITPVPSRLEQAPELSAMFLERLPLLPTGIGRPCSDRSTWGSAGAKVAALVAQADGLLTKSMPPWNESTYWQVSDSGSRDASENMMMSRKAWLYPLVIAECATWQGKYTAAIRTTLRELALQPTWNLAGPNNVDAYARHQWLVDLVASQMAHELAQSLYLLGDRVDAETRKVVLDALELRIFKPMRATYDGSFAGPYHWWLTSSGNWNAVCLAGVTGAALAVLPSRHDRARFAAGAAFFGRNYLLGFTDSGYATEGPVYWGYGMRHFSALRSILHAASGQAIDLLANAKGQAAGLYASRIEMTPSGNIAMFSDSSQPSGVDPYTRAYMAATFGTASAFPGVIGAVRTDSFSWTPIVDTSVYFGSPVPTAKGFETPLSGWPGTSSYFSDVGILVTRSAQSEPVPLAATIKSAGNGGHSHDDVGSYTIALGMEQPVGDVGSGRYTDRTFSDQRRTIRWISSYGHPVPLVGGRVQVDAVTAKNTVSALRLTEGEDEVTIDMGPAYALPVGWTLQRTLRNSRAAGVITLTDSFAFSAPQTFEVAITTLGNVRQPTANTLEIWQQSQVLRASIESSAPIALTAETIDEDGLRFQRIAIRFQAPAANGWLRLTYQR